MTTDIPRRYRFAALRRAGLFDNVPPSLLITLAIGVIVGWLAVLAHAPLPLAVAPLFACGLIGFGRVGARPIHELLPRLIIWGWRRWLRRHRSLQHGTPLKPTAQAICGLDSSVRPSSPGALHSPQHRRHFHRRVCRCRKFDKLTSAPFERPDPTSRR